MGESGEKRFKTLVTAALPTMEKEVTLEAAHAKLEALSTGHLFWVSVMLKGPQVPRDQGQPLAGWSGVSDGMLLQSLSSEMVEQFRSQRGCRSGGDCGALQVAEESLKSRRISQPEALWS